MANNDRKKRAIIISVISIIEVFLFAGPIYGWPSMVPILVKEGYFTSNCLSPNSSKNVNATSYDDHCVDREKKLNLVFTVAVVSLTFVQFPFGIMVDRIAWHKLRSIGSVVFTLSGILWLTSAKHLSYLLFAGATLLNISGFFLYFPLIQMINKTFVKNKSLVMSLLSGAYDSSAALLSVMKVAYDNGVSFTQIWLVYTSLGAVTTASITLYFAKLNASMESSPNNTCTDSVALVDKDRPSLPRSVSEETDDATNVQDIKQVAYEKALIEDTLPRNSGEDAEDELRDATRIVPDRKSLWNYMASPIFITQVTFLCLTNLRVVSYIGNLNTTLVTKLHCDNELTSKYLTIFGTIQLFGLPLSLIIGPLLDGKLIKRNLPLEHKRAIGGITGLMLTNTVQLLLNVLAVTPILELQVLTFLCHSTLRAFLFASNFSVLATIVPARHYGKLASFCLSFMGIFSALQYPLFDLVEEVLQGDPLWVDVGFLLVSIVLYVYPCKMYIRYKMNRNGTIDVRNI